MIHRTNGTAPLPLHLSTALGFAVTAVLGIVLGTGSAPGAVGVLFVLATGASLALASLLAVADFRTAHRVAGGA